MVRVYCGAPDECIEQDVVNLFGASLEKLGVKTAFLHSECCPSTILEKTAEEIDEAERRSPTGTNLPLQPNSLYAYMKIEGTLSMTKHPVVKLLEMDVQSKKKSPVIPLPVSLPQEKDYKPISITVKKDIIFTDEDSGKEVGWYNRRTNIIWVSDLFHLLDNSKKVMARAFETILEYKKYGKIPEILSIGADPEFEILAENGELIGAHTVFEHGEGEIGYDGHKETGEIRPPHSNNPLGLTRNIKRLLRRLNNLQCMIGTKVLVGGGTHVSTGGHIHFGMKGMSKEVQEILYDLVATPVLEYQTEFRSKHETENFHPEGGKIVRSQPHGCEWRPLPSFIVNEELTAAILCTVYAIVKSCRYFDYKRKHGPPKAADYPAIPLYSAYKEQIDNFVTKFIDKKLTKVSFHKKNILSEWNMNKLHEGFNVTIFSCAKWITDYFTPLKVKIKNPVKIEIRFGGDAIATYGINGEYLKDLIDFAEEHFLPLTQVTEKLPKGTARPLIVLPGGWLNVSRKSQFCSAFRVILKDIILRIGRE